MKRFISILLLLVLTAPSVVQYFKHTDMQVHLSIEMEEIKDKDSKTEKKSKEYLSYCVSISNFSTTASTATDAYSFFVAADPHLELQSPPPDVTC